MTKIQELQQYADELDAEGFHERANKVDALLKRFAADPVEVMPPKADTPPADPKEIQEIHAQAAWLKQQVDFLNRQAQTATGTMDPKKINYVARLVEEANYQISQQLQAKAGFEGDLTKEAAAKRFDVEAAKKEVKKQTSEQINKATAFTWASRALACYEFFMEEKSLEWFVRASHFADEACEHSAMVCDEGRTLAIVEKALERAKKKLPQKLQVMDF